jgi:hypothetical protein
MKLEDLEEYHTLDGIFYRYTDVNKLYKHQQEIINNLISNSESQAETNQVLVNRLLELKTWLEVEIEKRSNELDNYAEASDFENSYAQGIIEGLELTLEKLK